MSVTEIKRSVCSICSRECVLNITVKDGKAVAVESSGDPAMGGAPCVKGRAMLQYVYRPDRLLSPMRRTGPKGSGQFEPISWEEAYAEIAQKLNGYKAQYGADSVAFYTGYSKWYRTLLHRFVHAFGTQNYGSESSSCFRATVLAAKLNSGFRTMPDTAHAGALLNFGGYHGRPSGMKLVAVNPNITPELEAQADMILRILPGTDGALALGLAREFIRLGFVDREYIDKNVLGYPEFAAYVESFTPEYTAELTGLTAQEIRDAAALLAANPPFAVQEGGSAIVHHKNGVQNYRAINALSAITGYFDREGGNLPVGNVDRDPNIPGGLLALEFLEEIKPKDSQKIGREKYPVWSELIEEYQAMELAEQILTQKPYPLKALFSLGMNVRMFPDNGTLFKALEEVEFFVDVDLFMTDSAKYADIILPACSSLERDELINAGMGQKLYYSHKAIEPLGQSKSDDVILAELGQALGMDDIICQGADACHAYMMREMPYTLEDVKASPVPVDVPMPKYAPGERTKDGFNTPSGKFELWSTQLEKYGLDPLPTYRVSLDDADPEKFPLQLVSGVRYEHVFHTRTHSLPWLRTLRPKAAVDIHPEDAAELGIAQDDLVELSTQNGAITVRANLRWTLRRGTVNMYHGYSEADVNALLPAGHNDYISGFPGYRSLRCAVRRKDELPEGKFRFNPEKCTACGICSVACMQAYGLHTAAPWRQVSCLERPDGEGGIAFISRSVACVHCTDAACMAACEQGCFHRTAEGLVAYSPANCIGCRKCERACPVGAIQITEQGRVSKCHGCAGRLVKGQLPVCAEACPHGAIEIAD